MRAIETGTEVIHASHTGTYLYGGPSEHGQGWTSIRVSIGGGATATIVCDPDQVAPADVVRLNPADPRYRIEKLPRSATPGTPARGSPTSTAPPPPPVRPRSRPSAPRSPTPPSAWPSPTTTPPRRTPP